MHKRIVLTVAVVLAILVAGPMVPDVSAQETDEALSLRLVQGTSSFVLGEPVTLVALLQNTSGEAREAFRHLGPEFGVVTYRITGPEGRTEEFTSWALMEAAEPMVELQPNEYVGSVAELSFNGETWTFDKPGDYVVEARYLEQVSSDPLTIQIAPPSGAEEEEAANMLLDSEQASFFLLLNGGDHLQGGMEILEQLTEQFPETPHAAHANLALGINLLSSFPLPEEERLREADPERALHYLDRVDPKKLGIEGLIQSRIALALAYKKLGEEEKASRTFEQLSGQLRDRFPQTREPIQATIVPELREILEAEVEETLNATSPSR